MATKKKKYKRTGYAKAYKKAQSSGKGNGARMAGAKAGSALKMAQARGKLRLKVTGGGVISASERKMLRKMGGKK